MKQNLNSGLMIESKLPGIGASIFSVMSGLARQQNAVNLSQGFPDFDCDPELIEKVERAMKDGQNQYAPAMGILPLREAISAKVLEWYGATYHPESEITITSGATEALFSAITALVHPGDEVLVVEPAYDSYVPAILLSGGVPIFTRLRHPDYKIDWEDFKSKVSDKTRLVILNSPHNPTGSVLNEADISELENALVSSNAIVLSDEVYEHIIFDGQAHLSMTGNSSLKERSVVVSSFGKSFHTTGWKVGYILAPENLTNEIRKVHQFVTFSTSTPFQVAMAEYMSNGDKFSELKNFYQAKRDQFREMIKSSRFEILPCKGSYFQNLGFRNITDESDFDFAKRLVMEKKIASIPLSSFYKDGLDEKVLRFCFAKKHETLEKAAEILKMV